MIAVNQRKVEVQAEITEVLDATSESSVQMLDSFTAYHLARAEVSHAIPLPVKSSHLPSWCITY